MSNTKNLLGFLAGAAVGIGIGILLAPDKGSATRKKIKESFDEQLNRMKLVLEDLKTRIDQSVGNSKEEISKTFDEIATEMQYATPEVLHALEEKLEALKKTAAKL